MIKKTALALSFIASAAVTGSALADYDSRWYISPNAGITFSDDSDLDIGPLINVGLGVPLGRIVNIEFNADYSRLNLNDEEGDFYEKTDFSVDSLLFFNRGAAHEFYGRAGIVALYARIKNQSDGETTSKFAPGGQLGLGWMHELSQNVKLRADVRYRLDVFRGDEELDNDIFYDWGATFGAVFPFGDIYRPVAPKPRPTIAVPAIPTLPPVTFPLDSAVLTSSAKGTLDGVAQILNEINLDPSVVGHADDTGTAGYNLELGQRRAQAVRSYLMSKGIDGSRLRTDSRGEAEPIAENGDESGRQLNRRVEFELY